MKAYHFIKYDDSTSLEHLITQTDNNTVLCFDFEDSIQDCLHQENTSTLKAKYRNYFRNLIDRCNLDINKINIGIRLNSIDSPEYALDLIALSEIKYIAIIFLPKINDRVQILTLQNDLEKNRIRYDEIIPVIETKRGLNNLQEILSNDLTKISSIAFGHCDYNFDNKHYPFFHQDSREYWSWIIKIFGIIKSYKLRLINSPCLQLDSDKYFINTLKILYSICGNNCDQITLTKNQSALCTSFSAAKTNITLPKIINRLDLRVPGFYAEKFIESFEKKCLNKGFAINDDRILLTPQEYLSSLSYQTKADFKDINFTYVGGCFPVQENIPFENRFHQILKKKVEEIENIKFNVNIIRYERYRNCTNKIVSYKEKNPIDIMVFSIRPEPFLRLVKLYYKFNDRSNGKTRASLNVPAFNKVYPEMHDLLSTDSGFNPTLKNNSSILRKALINLNYILGSLIGNSNYSCRKYIELVNGIIEFSKINNIKLFILGPPIRSNTIMEKFLSGKLDKFMRKNLTISPDDFISGSDLGKNQQNLFEKFGIHATEKYHEVIAGKLFEKIFPVIERSLSQDPVSGQFAEKVNRNLIDM